jgi:hypothetical protein
MNNVLTASRMSAIRTCPRRHFWSYEIGLRKNVETSIALHFGGAWARAMEARWDGRSYEDALVIAIPEGIQHLDSYECAKVAALLAAYYDYYGPIENCAKIHPEVQFKKPIDGWDGASNWSAQGKMDGLGVLVDERQAIVEAKTTRCNIAPESDYWQRLRFNEQLLQYISESRKYGWNPEVVYYDVTRKPAIRPREVTCRDEEGPIVIEDATGKRAYVEKGPKGKKVKVARQSGGEGYTVQKRMETPDEYSDRLWHDALARPEFYFRRWEVPVLDDQVREFQHHRLQQVHLIEHYRSMERFGPLRDQHAWPRHVMEANCNNCSYKSFCLQGVEVDLGNLPAGFSIQPFNPELDTYDDSSETSEDDSSSSQ